MREVSRKPLRAPRAGAPAGLSSRLRALGSAALTLALLATLAPLGPVARAQAPSKGQAPPIVEGPSYVIYQRPDGEVSCRLALPGEIERNKEDGRIPLYQINHLGEKGSDSASPSASAGLTIILRATERLNANPAAKQAFINAAAKWEALISSPITVTIDVDYGPDFFNNTNDPYGENTLGATSQGGFRIPYPTIRERLISRSADGSQERALLNSLPVTTLPTDIGNIDEVFVPTSMMYALGITNFNDPPIPRIGFNTKFSFDFNPADGIIGTDFDSVAVHEIGHALGFTSRVGALELTPSGNRLATIWDFYRFRPGTATAGTFSTAQRILSSGTSNTDPHVYFGGGPEVALSTGKPDGNGGDGEQASHWKDNRLNGGLFIGIMDPTISPGTHEEITENDIKAIDFFGYSVGAIPQPPNDNFAAAQQLTGSAGRVTGTNRGASREQGEPVHSNDPNDTGGRSVWYRWTAPSTGSVTFNTGQGTGPGEPRSNYDTTLAAYTGTHVATLTPLAKNDDDQSGQVTSTITFNAVGGTTYMIAVDGYDGDFGQIALNWNHSGSDPTTVQFGAASFSASEGAGSGAVTVTRAGGTGVAFSVNYVVSPGTAGQGDYFATAGTLNFAVGEMSKSFTVQFFNETVDEPEETLNLSLSNPTNGVGLGTPAGAVLTILDDDPPVVSGNNVTVTEGNAGTTSAVVTFTLSNPHHLPVSVGYQTGDGTAAAGSDYVAASGTLSFAPGETSKTVAVAVNGDTAVEQSEFFRVDLVNPVNATAGSFAGITINNDDSAPPPPPPPPGSGSVIQFGAQGFSGSETQGSALVTVTRSGDTTTTVSAHFRTVDNPAAVPCSDNQSTPYAYARCDYATTVETVTFAPGETTKTIAVPLIDDTYGEPAESTEVALSNPSAGAQLGALSKVVLFIFSNEAAGQNGATNPVVGVPFFVRQHYLDFLSREPEVGEPWSNVLNGCVDQFNQSATGPAVGCDRITVSAAFLGSPEFSLKGGYAFRFYKAAFGRLPEYTEIVVDMRQLTGATGPEVIAKRAAYPAAFVQRADFVAAFAAMSNADFVNTLMNRYGQNLLMITSRTPNDPENGQKIGLSRTGMTAALNNGQWTRAQVLRAIADSDEVTAREFRPAFVAMQYYGYLRRTPEITGYNAWLNYLNQNPDDSRTMVNGFLNSQEYRLRFGPQ